MTSRRELRMTSTDSPVLTRIRAASVAALEVVSEDLTSVISSVMPLVTSSAVADVVAAVRPCSLERIFRFRFQSPLRKP